MDNAAHPWLDTTTQERLAAALSWNTRPMPDAVMVASGPDKDLAWHYGDPFNEQRRMVAGFGAMIVPNSMLPTATLKALSPRSREMVVWLGDKLHWPGRDLIDRSCPSPVGLGHLVVDNSIAAYVMVTIEPVGLWAYEALRIAARQRRPRQDVIAQGQALRLGHLDGSADEPLPPKGTTLSWEGRPVGRLRTSAQHYQLGPIGLISVTPEVPIGTTLLAGSTALLVT